MKTSYNGRAFLAREEGCVLSAYKDTVGVWTIGFGHTSAAGSPKVTPDLKVSLDEAFAIFARDLTKYEDVVAKAVKATLNQAQFDALVSWHYNTGAASKMPPASLIKKLNAGDYQGAADGLLEWNKAGGRVLPALAARRGRERVLFVTGNYGDISGLSVWQIRSGKATKMQFPKDAPVSISAPPVQPIAPIPVQPDDPGPDAPSEPTLDPPSMGFWASVWALFGWK